MKHKNLKNPEGEAKLLWKFIFWNKVIWGGKYLSPQKVDHLYHSLSWNIFLEFLVPSVILT